MRKGTLWDAAKLLSMAVRRPQKRALKLSLGNACRRGSPSLLRDEMPVRSLARIPESRPPRPGERKHARDGKTDHASANHQQSMRSIRSARALIKGATSTGIRKGCSGINR